MRSVINFTNAFVKLTGWIAQKLVFRTKIYYEDRSVQGRRIKGRAIIASNHTSIYDYAVYLFVFLSRTLRFQVAEVMFRKKAVGCLLRMLGCIYVDRYDNNFSFIHESERILAKGGVVGVFPESRLPVAGEATPLEFKPSCAYLALMTDTPIVPVYTNGRYFTKHRARVIIGRPIVPSEVIDQTLSEKEQIEQLNRVLREKIIDLEKLINEKLKG